MCVPLKSALNNGGLAESYVFMMLNSARWALPAPEPPVPETEDTCDAPQLNEWMAISFVWPVATLSPLIPSSFRKKSVAINSSFQNSPGPPGR